MTTRNGQINWCKRFTPEQVRLFIKNALAVFGDNAERTGRGGQAAVFRDYSRFVKNSFDKEMEIDAAHRNAIGIITKWAPHNFGGAFLSDDNYAIIAAKNARAWEILFDWISRGGTIWLPTDGIGTGLAQLPTRAPRIYAEICSKIAALRAMAATEIDIDNPQKQLALFENRFSQPANTQGKSMFRSKP